MKADSLITRDLPNAVTYDLSNTSQTTIILPSKSTWTSGLHWHESHTEYLRVVKGAVRVRLGDKTTVVSANKGLKPVEVRVAPYVLHQWSRADPRGEEVVVIERTDPADVDKTVFFYNLNGVVLKAQRVNKPRLLPKRLFDLIVNLWVSLNLFTLFYAFDNFPAFCDFTGRLLHLGIILQGGSVAHRWVHIAEMYCSHLILKLASLVSWAIGVEALQRNLTPDDVYKEWKTAKEKRLTL
jgi:uncharacterized RmlC-like cupin family protein